MSCAYGTMTIIIVIIISLHNICILKLEIISNHNSCEQWIVVDNCIRVTWHYLINDNHPFPQYPCHNKNSYSLVGV